MLFKNIKTGNIIAAHDELTAELMSRSPIYQRVLPTVKPKKAPAKEQPEPKKTTTRKKTATAKS